MTGNALKNSIGAVARCLLLGCIALIAVALGSPPASAADGLDIRSSDKVEWKGKAGDLILILNLHADAKKLAAMAAEPKSTLLLKTALVESARTFAKTEYQSLAAIKVVFVDIKDMDEYGAGKGEWTEIGTVAVAKSPDKVAATMVTFKAAGLSAPAQMPSIGFPLKEEAAPVANGSAVRFLMPKKIWLVAGVPQDFFFENLVVTKNFDDVLFSVSGKSVMAFASQQQRRALHFAPTEASVGEHELTITVKDWEGKVVAEGTTTVVVTPANTAKAPAPVRILVIGHSLPSMYWPAYLNDMLSAPGNPDVTFIGGIKYWYGSYPDMRNNPKLDAMYHEASPGYTFQALLTRYSDQPAANPNMPSQSPFLFKDGDAPPKLDMKRYLRERLNNIPPDFIVLNVGDNDTFDLEPGGDNREVEAKFDANANMFLDRLREMAPNAVIGAMMPNTYNISEQSFLSNYGAKYPRWRQMQNRQRYIELMTAIAEKRKDFTIIPSNFVVDSLEGMPYNSGTHFNNLGARQFASAAYAWLKGQFAGKFGTAPASEPIEVVARECRPRWSFLTQFVCR